jgi:hypothetical protein
MSFFQNLFGFKPKITEPVSDLSSQENNNTNHIAFIMKSINDQDPYVKINVVDTSKDASMQFAEMLFNINAGYYHQSILDLMLKMSSTDDSIREFIENTIIFWTIKLKQQSIDGVENKTTEDNNQPYISPMDFNKHATK